MKDRDWVPRDEPTRLIVFAHIDSHIDDYAEALQIDDGRKKKVHGACKTVVAAITYANNFREAAAAITTWKNRAMNDLQHSGDALSAPPAPSTFVIPADGMFGAIDFMRKEVKKWKEADGYTPEIGAFLRIVPAQSEQLGAVQPEIKSWQIVTGFKVIAEWKKGGFKMIKFRYQAKGSAQHQEFIRSNSPAVLPITPQNPTQPETGFIDAVYMENDEEVGLYTDKHEVTLF